MLHVGYRVIQCCMLGIEPYSAACLGMSHTVLHVGYRAIQLHVGYEPTVLMLGI